MRRKEEEKRKQRNEQYEMTDLTESLKLGLFVIEFSFFSNFLFYGIIKSSFHHIKVIISYEIFH